MLSFIPGAPTITVNPIMALPEITWIDDPNSAVLGSEKFKLRKASLSMTSTSLIVLNDVGPFRRPGRRLHAASVFKYTGVYRR